jgi:hypothetical protein
MFLVSMRANYLYGFGIGQSEDTKLAIAWANVGADLWKGFGLIVVVTLWRSAWRRAAAAISLTWLVCLGFSVSSAIGIYVQERTALTSGREARHASYEDAQGELGQVETKLKGIIAARPVEAVEAAVAGVLARSVLIGDRARGTVGGLSSNCAKPDTHTADDCVEVARLREELALAVEASRLEVRRRHLREQVSALRNSGGGAMPDPVGEFWAWVTRGWVSVKDVGFGLPLGFALMIEMVTAFGPLGIVSYAEATRGATEPDTSGHVRSRLVMTGTVATERVGGKENGRVVHYMAERTEPTSHPTAIGVEELFADYQVWCLSKSLQALSCEEFVEEFDRVRESPQLAGKIKKFGSRYFGIAFVRSSLELSTK